MSRLHDHKTGKIKEEKRIAELKKQNDDDEDKFLTMFGVSLWHKPYERVNKK